MHFFDVAAADDKFILQPKLIRKERKTAAKDGLCSLLLLGVSGAKVCEKDEKGISPHMGRQSVSRSALKDLRT